VRFSESGPEAVIEATTRQISLMIRGPRRPCQIANRSFRSIRPDTRELDHLCPLLGFGGDNIAEIYGRQCKRGAAKAGDPRLDLGVDEGRVYLLIEFLDNLSGRVLWRADAIHRTRLVPGHEIAQGWNVRQGFRAGCRSHPQRTKRAGSDVLE